MKNKALLIIDMQKGSFNWDWPPHDWEGVIRRINDLSRIFRQKSLPVIFIQHDGSGTGNYERNTEAWELLDELTKGRNDIVIDKKYNDAFHKTRLKLVLDNAAVDELYITGTATDFCVEATLQSALAKDFKVTVVNDAHTTEGTPNLSAEKVIEHYNWVWGNMLTETDKLKLVESKKVESIC